MHPDYSHKIFNDRRISYTLLMLALAMDAAQTPVRTGTGGPKGALEYMKVCRLLNSKDHH